MEDKTKQETVEIPKLSKSESALMPARASTNVWQDVKTDLTKAVDKTSFNNTVNLCRFFYKTEPIVSTVINKLVEIGINDIIISKSGLSDNEFRVFKSLKPRILEFCETMAQELLISGLVIPEIGYGPIDKDELFELGIKKYNRLTFPVSMWIRDPNSIQINSSLMSDSPSYYVIIPDDVIFFIKNKGKYSDGTEDKDLFEKLKTYYPDFVSRVTKGEVKFLIENKLILRRKYLPDNPYPIPYISAALNALQHKRRMRRMDYSIMDKAISAIMHIKVGSDDYPVTNSEEDREVLADLRNQLSFRFQSDQYLERIFQLITNHTVDINWIFPDMNILKENARYSDINEEILFGLGFPRILITGEASKTGTSDAELAILSPVKTMESLRRKLLKVVRDVFKNVAKENNFKIPYVTFKALNLHNFVEFMNSLEKLYNMSGVSRTSVADYLGFDFSDEVDVLEQENKEIEKRGLSPFGEQPFSRDPNKEQQPADQEAEPPADKPKPKQNGDKTQ